MARSRDTELEAIAPFADWKWRGGIAAVQLASALRQRRRRPRLGLLSTPLAFSDTGASPIASTSALNVPARLTPVTAETSSGVLLAARFSVVLLLHFVRRQGVDLVERDDLGLSARPSP